MHRQSRIISHKYAEIVFPVQAEASSTSLPLPGLLAVLVQGERLLPEHNLVLAAFC